MLEWLTGTLAGKLFSTFFISMVPFVELRLGLPYGLANGLTFIPAYCAAVIGNIIPAPLIILYIRKLFAWLRVRSAWFERLVTRLERKGEQKSEAVDKYGLYGLVLLVAVPLPGTGAWTGALVAALLDIRIKRAVPAIFAGLVISGLVVSAITLGVVSII